jgi:hypothetical protein
MISTAGCVTVPNKLKIRAKRRKKKKADAGSYPENLIR